MNEYYHDFYPRKESMYSSLFWAATLERAVVTFLQFAAVLVPANWMTLQINWLEILLYCFIGFILSFAKAMLAGLKNGSPSVIDAEVVATAKGRHSLQSL